MTLASYDDLFSNNENEVISIDLSDLIEFKDHPFSIPDDENFASLMRSIDENGIITPITVRKTDGNKYEIISGHRRVTASRRLNLETIPALVKDISDEEAIIQMVDANLQRENLLPMDRAKAYQMKMDALKKLEISGRRDEILASNSGDSARTIQRYLRLNNLIEDLQEMVDDKKLPFNTAVEISFLSEKDQENLLSIILKKDKVPSLKNATQIKQALLNDSSNAEETIEKILEKKESLKTEISVSKRIKDKYFKDLSDKEIEEKILDLLNNEQLT